MRLSRQTGTLTNDFRGPIEYRSLNLPLRPVGMRMPRENLSTVQLTLFRSGINADIRARSENEKKYLSRLLSSGGVRAGIRLIWKSIRLES